MRTSIEKEQEFLLTRSHQEPLVNLRVGLEGEEVIFLVCSLFSYVSTEEYRII